MLVLVGFIVCPIIIVITMTSAFIVRDYIKERKIKVKIAKKIQELTLKFEATVRKLLSDSSQTHPWLAEEVAEISFLLDSQIAIELQSKSHPALKAAEEVTKIAKEKRQLIKETRLLQQQLSFYEYLFPWLDEFKELDINDAVKAVKGFDSEGKTEYEHMKSWLSPEEYQALPSAQKYQLALERYKERKKTNWEIGIEYERYIGYLLEFRGYKVEYTGALSGLEDMGRDLIAKKDVEVLVIQCKRWAEEKKIHEKHIFQLYGSLVMLASEHPDQNYKGVFITTTTLSETARRCADYLKIECIESFEYKEYPLIKCNISKNGEKIYHLPFDQQYDRIVPKKGAGYAWTVADAEAAGFRRAWKWIPKKE